MVNQGEGMLDASSIVRRSDRQVSCDLNGEAAILQLDQAVYFGLKGVGAHVWARLEQPQSIADLRRSVCAEFEIEASRCEADLLDFLSELQRAGLVEIAR